MPPCEGSSREIYTFTTILSQSWRDWKGICLFLDTGALKETRVSHPWSWPHPLYCPASIPGEPCRLPRRAGKPGSSRTGRGKRSPRQCHIPVQNISGCFAEILSQCFGLPSGNLVPSITYRTMPGAPDAGREGENSTEQGHNEPSAQQPPSRGPRVGFGKEGAKAPPPSQSGDRRWWPT